MEQKERKYDLTTGVIWKKLLLFFLPIAIGTLFQQLYNTVDAMVVGKFVGKEALAAVGGSAAQIIALTVGFFVALTGGASAVIAQFVGARRSKETSEAIHSALGFAVLAAVVITVVILPLTPTLLRWMKTPEDTMLDSIRYLRIYFSGTIFVLLFNMGSSILQAVGDSRRPLYYLMSCCFCNIALDLLFVIVFQMGIAGVALATVLSQVLSTVLVLRRLCCTDEIYKVTVSKIRIYKVVTKKMLKVGIPAGIQASMYNISNLIIQIAVNTLSTSVVAGWTMATKIDGVYCALGMALGMAVMGFVGQNYGAGKMDRVRKTFKVSMAIFLCVTLVMEFCVMYVGKYCVHYFIDDPDVIKYTWEILLYFVPFYVVWTFIEVISGVLRGIGDAVVPVIITGTGICALRLVWCATVFQRYPSIAGITSCYPVSWIITAVALFIYYRHGNWLREDKSVTAQLN